MTILELPTDLCSKTNLELGRFQCKKKKEINVTKEEKDKKKIEKEGENYVELNDDNKSTTSRRRRICIISISAIFKREE